MVQAEVVEEDRTPVQAVDTRQALHREAITAVVVADNEACTMDQSNESQKLRHVCRGAGVPSWQCGDT
ncbi:unnamed protein product [Heligmosomoides polygyrus]|uniref:Uncharacterized protein n=1 Tax=Heligmosomoides polygyrus TaxID=6339 RepID=A0A183FE46_HELPZ|nr:unnamed protein product [Heligmosomoides polygyrus]